MCVAVSCQQFEFIFINSFLFLYFLTLWDMDTRNLLRRNNSASRLIRRRRRQRRRRAALVDLYPNKKKEEEDDVYSLGKRINVRPEEYKFEVILFFSPFKKKKNLMCGPKDRTEATLFERDKTAFSSSVKNVDPAHAVPAQKVVVLQFLLCALYFI